MAVAFDHSGLSGFSASSVTTVSGSITTSASTLIVLATCSEDSGGATTVFAVPTCTGLTFTKAVDSAGSTSQGQAIIYSAADSAGGTRSITQTASPADFYGFAAASFTGASGIGASTATHTAGSTSQSLALTTTAANSGILFCLADWQAVNNTTRTYLTVNSFTPVSGGTGEVTYQWVSGQWTTYVAYWPNVGAAGSKTVGLSTTITGGHAMAAVEILASASGPPALAPRPRIWLPQLHAADRAARW